MKTNEKAKKLKTAIYNTHNLLKLICKALLSKIHDVKNVC